MKQVACLLVFVFAALVQTSCAPSGKRPFMMAQLCLESEAGVQAFAEELRSIAQSEGMTFSDGSIALTRDLEAIDEVAVNAVPELAEPVIGITLYRRDGMGMDALNQRFPGHQVVLGFSEGSEEEEARAFSDRVIERLKQHWDVHIIPSDRGAMPLENCS